MEGQLTSIVAGKIGQGFPMMRQPHATAWPSMALHINLDQHAN